MRDAGGGITGTLFSATLALYGAWLAVIDDQWREGELHLLRLAPGAWFKPGDRCRFDAMPTEYGPVTLWTARSADGKTLEITWKPAFRDIAPKVIMHKPPVAGLRTLLVNGKRARSVSGLVMLD